jgi:hypothetical protein
VCLLLNLETVYSFLRILFALNGWLSFGLRFLDLFIAVVNSLSVSIILWSGQWRSHGCAFSINQIASSAKRITLIVGWFAKNSTSIPLMSLLLLKLLELISQKLQIPIQFIALFRRLFWSDIQAYILQKVNEISVLTKRLEALWSFICILWGHIFITVITVHVIVKIFIEWVLMMWLRNGAWIGVRMPSSVGYQGRLSQVVTIWALNLLDNAISLPL